MAFFSTHGASPSLLPEVQLQQVTSQPGPEAPLGGDLQQHELSPN